MCLQLGVQFKALEMILAEQPIILHIFFSPINILIMHSVLNEGLEWPILPGFQRDIYACSACVGSILLQGPREPYLLFIFLKNKWPHWLNSTQLSFWTRSFQLIIQLHRLRSIHIMNVWLLVRLLVNCLPCSNRISTRNIDCSGESSCYYFEHSSTSKWNT